MNTERQPTLDQITRQVIGIGEAENAAAALLGDPETMEFLKASDTIAEAHGGIAPETATPPVILVESQKPVDVYGDTTPQCDEEAAA